MIVPRAARGQLCVRIFHLPVHSFEGLGILETKAKQEAEAEAEKLLAKRARKFKGRARRSTVISLLLYFSVHAWPQHVERCVAC